MISFIFAFIFIWIPCGIYTAVVAGEKGHVGINWFFGGLVFGPIALIAAVGLGDNKLRNSVRHLRD